MASCEGLFLVPTCTLYSTPWYMVDWQYTHAWGMYALSGWCDRTLLSQVLSPERLIEAETMGVLLLVSCGVKV